MPEFEERSAASAAMIPWADYQQLPHGERAHIVAHYRMSAIVERHSRDVSEREQKRRDTINRTR